MARQMLETAAVIGRSFELDTVRAASGRSDEEAAEGLDELVGGGLVRELSDPEPSYDFTHDKLRELVYDEITLARRGLLHRRVAEAISRDRPALVAQHLRLAGDHAGAAEQYRLAGEHAASLLAHADALEHFEAALALGYPDTAALHERIGDLRTLLGDYAGALASYESAAAHGEPTALAGVEHKLGGVLQRRGEWERAEARYAVALEAASADDAGLRARILADLSLTVHQGGQSPGRPSWQSRRVTWPRPPPMAALRRRPTTCSACSPSRIDASSRRATSSSAAWPWRSSSATRRLAPPRSTTWRWSPARQGSWIARSS